jgi:hypothetical protein
MDPLDTLEAISTIFVLLVAAGIGGLFVGLLLAAFLWED